MLRLCLGIYCLVMVTGCASAPRSRSATSPIVFITREGCAATAAMRANLDAALRTLGRSTTYTVIDTDTLPESDRRGGYGTPTVLVGNADLFGMPEPANFHPPAT